MLFQKQKISRDVQNMMPKIKTYRSIPKKEICTSSSSLLIRSRKFSMTSRIKKIRLPKKIIRSRDFKSRLREDADQRHRGFCLLCVGKLVHRCRSIVAFVLTIFPSLSTMADLMIQDVVKSTWADHCRKKNRVNRELKVQNMPPQRNINSTRLRADKKNIEASKQLKSDVKSIRKDAEQDSLFSTRDNLAVPKTN